MHQSAFLCIAASFASISATAQAADFSKYFSMEAKGFKRFSVSAGTLHVMPQGKAQPFTVQTAVPDGTVAKNGAIKVDTVLNNLNKNVDQAGLATALKSLGYLTGGTLPANWQLKN